METSSNTEAHADHDLPGDPDCPYCGGTGYVRADVPVGHPDFGKLQLCVCRRRSVSEHMRRRLFALSNLDALQHLTFENFEPRGRIGIPEEQARSLERAFTVARRYAQTLKGWLLLQGNYGCGKTHLAAAIANFAVSMNIPTLFLTVPDLLDGLRFSYNDPESTFEQRFEEVRTVRLLILDDFGTQNATAWAQEKLFQIVNYRYINHLPLVVTTNLSLREIEPRIRSRLQDPELVDLVEIRAPDYRNPSRDLGHSALSALTLFGEKTFGTFQPRTGENLSPQERESLRKAVQAAQDFAEDPQGWLVFMGPYGSGKTHLAAAIANYRTQAGQPPLFVIVPDLLDHLRATFSPEVPVRFDRLFEEVRTAPLLVLDDLGTQAMTPWVREKLYQLFNYRYNAELPTVITTANSLEEIDERIRSRLMDRRLCRMYVLQAPPYTGEAPPAGRRKSRRRKK